MHDSPAEAAAPVHSENGTPRCRDHGRETQGNLRRSLREHPTAGRRGKAGGRRPVRKKRKGVRGLYIFNVATIEEAEKLVMLDPAVKAGVFVPDLTLWYGSAAMMVVNAAQENREAEKLNPFAASTSRSSIPPRAFRTPPCPRHPLSLWRLPDPRRRTLRRFCRRFAGSWLWLQDCETSL